MSLELDKVLDKKVQVEGALDTSDESFFDDETMALIGKDYSFEHPKMSVDVGNAEGSNAQVRSILDPGQAPEIRQPADDEVLLPGGLVSPDGEILRTAVVRELTGDDEEALAKAKNSMVRFTRTLMRAVESIGGQPPTKEILADLLVGDREALVLGIRCATFGNEITYKNFICPGCQEALDITVDLRTIDVKFLEDPEKREFEVPLRNGVAVVRLPKVSDADAVMESPSLTTAEENTLLLSRCVLEINGTKVNKSKELVKKLGLKDRQTILDFLAEHQPGPRYDEVKSKHEACETEFPVYLAVDDLFRGL